MAEETVVRHPLVELREMFGAISRDEGLTLEQRARQVHDLIRETEWTIREAGQLRADMLQMAEVDQLLDAKEVTVARENADIREEMLRREFASPEQLDELGLLSHEELDELMERGELGQELREGRLAKALSLGEASVASGLKNFVSAQGQAFRQTPGGKWQLRNRLGRWIDMPRPPDTSKLSRVEPKSDKTPQPGEPGYVRPESGKVEQLEFGHARTALNDKALGEGVRDTLDKHTRMEGKERRYTAERRRLHQRIVADLLDSHEQGRENPEILFTMGGPSSGKSAILDADKGEDGVARVPSPDDAVHLDQDIVKAALGEYQELAAARDPYASDAVHREAADVYRAILKEAMRRRMNIVAEGTGDSGEGQFLARLRKAKDDGYGTHIVAVTLPTALAEERAIGRAKEQGRAVPVDGLRAMHANFARRFTELLDNLDLADRVDLWDNRGDWKKGEKPQEVLRYLTEDDQPQVLAEELLDELRAKRDEDPGTLIELPSFI